MIKIGSCFAGIGGFELGLERAIPNSCTIWQIEQNKYCQSILKKHWPNNKIYGDIRTINTAELEPVDIICGGFPCQDISTAGKMEGIHGKRSSLWFEMWRIISDLQPRIIVLENVPAITFQGLDTVLGCLAQLGYSAEWGIISARDFGAPHLRKRWFLVAYSGKNKPRSNFEIQTRRDAFIKSNSGQFAYSISYRSKARLSEETQRQKGETEKLNHNNRSKWWTSRSYWQETKPPLCLVDDGISQRVARLAALGNAIVPQCAEFIGHYINNSGILINPKPARQTK
jgi:DNA (cytosine-5)-methyltransferase 1